MAQSAKFIDVTQTFIPIDPMSFPESLHGTREDSPNEPIKAAAYEGQNFLPTSYGYKSYFGTNTHLDFNALASKADKVVLFQNESLQNILVALCNDGIWIKVGDTVGPWSKIHNIVPDVDPSVHYEWTFCVLANQLFAYQQGQPNYIKLSSSLVAPGIVATPIVPTFLNMSGQIGIFRAGGRLGFWDSASSIGWSDLDTYQDFEPSIETLAGNAIFKDVTGKIVTVQAHGKAFIIYATKSIVLVTPVTDTINQWIASSLLSAAGVSYPRQVAVANPDLLHFAYTGVGLYKIDKGEASLIVPEVTDFLKNDKAPAYLAVSEGRYLFIEILDPSYLNGLVQFTEWQTVSQSYDFPDGSYTIPGYDPINVTGTNVCTIMAAQDAGLNPGQNSQSFSDQKPNTRVKDIWTAFFSSGGNYDVGNIEWGMIPCGSAHPSGAPAWPTTPVGVDKLGDYANDAKKRIVTGSDMYIDGNMTMERFMQAQLAIWSMEERNKNAFLSAIGNKAYQGTHTTVVTSQPVVPPTRSECYIGRYAGAFTAPKFDYNACSFWLTRYAATAFDLYTITTTTTHYDEGSGPPAALLVTAQAAGVAHINSANANRASCLILYPDGYVCGGRNPTFEIVTTSTDVTVIGTTIGPPSLGSPLQTWTVFSQAYGPIILATVTKSVYNELREVSIPPTPDTGYCLKSGTTYTDISGRINNLSNTPTCANTVGALGTNRISGGSGGGPIPIDNNGSVCSIPFTPVTLPGGDNILVDWKVPSLEIPPSTYLLQKGSPAPLYPPIYGALVYDLHLKKWGKIVNEYKQLLDYSPINNISGRAIPYSTFGIMAGVLKSDGLVYLFDSQPANSYMTYGKIGYYRLGITSAEEVRVHFRTPSSGKIKVDTSLDRRLISIYLSVDANFTSALEAQVNGAFPGAWQNITISGIYDISYLEYRGFVQGRR